MAAGLFLARDTLFKPPQPKSPTKATIVSATDVKKNFDDKFERIQNKQDLTVATIDRFMIFDIRPTSEFRLKHIAGAQNAPLEFLERSSIDAGIDVVVYSPNQSDLDSAAKILSAKKVRNVYLLRDSLSNLEIQGYKMSEGMQ